MKEITYPESLSVEHSIYIDVRSPHEFEEDHIAGSLNVPLFDNSERKEIGTLYRMAGRDDAIVRGTEIVGEKLRDIIETIHKYKDKKIIVLCARGGMRSGSLVSLLDSLGMAVLKLKDGYKGYRRYVMSRLESLRPETPLVVLQGLTGSGKTEVIRKIAHAIDLEDMAGHRSSVFGGIDKIQKTQKRFESLILDRLASLKSAPCILIEGESRKIGNLHIPEALHGTMKKSPVIYLDATMERRVEIIYNEYHAFCDDSNIPAIVKSLTPKLGKKNVEYLTRLYAEGKIREFIHEMLIKYYDPLYRHSLDGKNYYAVVENKNTDDAAAAVRDRLNEGVKKNFNLIDT